MKNFDYLDSKREFTLGAELECWLVDKKSYDTVSKGTYLKNALDKSLVSQIHGELLESMIELVTPICKTPKEIANSLRALAKECEKEADKENFFLCALGTYPNGIQPFDIVKKDRYLQAYNEFGKILENFKICGLHLHIGLQNKDDAINVYNATINALPYFIALSASSPFFDGEDTKLQSYRQKISELIPRSGIPNYYDNYDEFENEMEILKESGFIEDITNIRTYVRIQPNFGTVELRVCDAVGDMKRVELIAAFFQAFAKFFSKNDIQKLPYQLLSQNCWSASRYGFEAKFCSTFGVSSLKDELLALLGILEFEDVKYKEEIMELIEKKSIADKIREAKNKEDMINIGKII